MVLDTYKLKRKILDFKENNFPPGGLHSVSDLPIYYGDKALVESYLKKWLPFYDEVNHLSLEEKINIYEANRVTLNPEYALPIICRNVERLIINKTHSKESITFRGLASLLQKCGDFKESEILAMSDYLSEEDAALVAHKPHIDIRAYVFHKDDETRYRTRFYSLGMIISTVDEGFELLDHRFNNRKKRRDAYSDPIASNEFWSIFKKTR